MSFAQHERGHSRTRSFHLATHYRLKDSTVNVAYNLEF
jgi:hypothetical protein